ncbi:glutamine-rich protein 2-like isoform X2 [Engystomops pustulosus]
MTVSGQVIPTIPRLPCFPVHLSKRPHTVFAIGQVRQQSFRLKSRIHQARREASQLEMSIKHLHSMHSQLCQEIARVQLHFGGSDKASRKTIGHLLQAHCVTLGKISKRTSSSQRLGRLPELNIFGSESNSSSGGGRQTLISSQRYYTKAGILHAQQKEGATAAVLKKEIIILGQKAPIYEGRRDSNLPPNKHKDGKRMSTTDNVLSRRFEENAYTAHRRPQLSNKLSY